MLTNTQVKELARKSGESASLRLDKFADTNSRKKTEELKQICELAAQRKFPPHQLKCDAAFQLTLCGRLIVNHSGGVLENAGLCLHKFFNYPMIPGSALKGITRHYARRIKADTDDIRRIFGDDTENGSSSGGTIAFLAAIPVDSKWRLVPDILTPHKDDSHNPVPIPFIAVEKGAVFQFALKKTSRGTDVDLQTAEQWLKAALSENGVGGKTTSGYGCFIGDHAGQNIELKLITPGFFGGADVYTPEDTGLRISSLRGMLRYWWRIAMSEFLSPEKSKEMEDLIWGHTKRAGLVRLSIKQAREVPQLFNYKDRYDVESSFAKKHGIDPKKSGLHYLAYGMDEKNGKRHYIEAGAAWTINVSVREPGLVADLTSEDVKNQALLAFFTSEDVKNQALLALSLLCRFGGLGSKSRKGFGSLYWNDAWTLEKCRQTAKQFAEKFERQSPTNAEYSFNKTILQTIDIPTADAWQAIDKLGLVVKQFASSNKHNDEKAAMGLPKQIHGPSAKPLPHQKAATHQRPERLNPKFERFAAPIWYHFEPSGTGLKLNILAFPSGKVVEEDVSRTMLQNLLDQLKETLTPSLFTTKPVGFAPNASRIQPTNNPTAAKTGVPKVGSKIKGVLVEEKTKKGGWKVKTDELGIGSIQNSAGVPPDKKPGDMVNLEVRINQIGAAQFKWIP